MAHIPSHPPSPFPLRMGRVKASLHLNGHYNIILTLFAGMVNQQYLSLTKIKKCLNLTKKNSLFKGSSWFWRILGWWGSETLLPLRINSLLCQAACLTSWKMTTNIERHFFTFLPPMFSPPSCFYLFCLWLLERCQKIPFHLSGLFSVSGLAFFFNSTFHSSVRMNQTWFIKTDLTYNLFP